MQFKRAKIANFAKYNTKEKINIYETDNKRL